MLGFHDLQSSVLEFAEKKHMLDKLRDQSTEIEFLGWFLFDMHAGDKKGETINFNELIKENATELLNWYIFVKVQKGRKTIGEMYADEQGDAELAKLVKGLKKPISAIVEVTSLQPEDRVYGKDLATNEELTIVSKDAYSNLKVGEGIAGILMKYGSEYYMAGRFEIIPAQFIELMKLMASTLEILRSEADAFIKMKEQGGASGKMLNRYRDALEGFLVYMEENPIEDIAELKASHISGYLSWMDEHALPSYSDSTMRKNLAALKEFFQCLYDKGMIKDDGFKNMVL